MQDRILKQRCICPLNGKICKDGVRSDFEDKDLKCRWWEQLWGEDPQTKKPVEQWDCSMAWMPIMLAENSMMSRRTTHSMDKVANIVNETKGAFLQMAKGLRNVAGEFQTLNENMKTLPHKQGEIEIAPNGNMDHSEE